MRQACCGRYDSSELALFRAIATIAVFTLAAAAFASCGSGDSSSTTTVTALATSSSAASASGSPASSATGTAAASPALSASVSPAATTASDTPTPFVNWTFSGQVVGSALVGVSGCQDRAGKFDIQLKGTLNGAAIGILISSASSGTLDFSQPLGTTVAVQYGSAGSAVNDYWFGTSGDAGMSGTATIDATGSGSANLTVPPSAVSPGGATQAISASGPWTCP